MITSSRLHAKKCEHNWRCTSYMRSDIHTWSCLSIRDGGQSCQMRSQKKKHANTHTYCTVQSDVATGDSHAKWEAKAIPREIAWHPSQVRVYAAHTCLHANEGKHILPPCMLLSSFVFNLARHTLCMIIVMLMSVYSLNFIIFIAFCVCPADQHFWHDGGHVLGLIFIFVCELRSNVVFLYVQYVLAYGGEKLTSSTEDRFTDNRSTRSEVPVSIVSFQQKWAPLWNHARCMGWLRT